jgi:hypothetical protein
VLNYAVSLARQIDAEVVALHVIEDALEEDGLLPFMLPPDSWPFLDIQAVTRPLDVLLRDRALDLWNFIDRSVPNSSQMKLKRLVRLGRLEKEIVSAARAENVDLIVLELRDRFLFPKLKTRKLLKMINKLPYPVLLAPKALEERRNPGRPILVFHAVPSESPA